MHHATQALISEHSVNTSPRSVRRLAVVTALALWLSACSTTRVNGPAPVEDRQTLPRPLVAVPGNMPAAVQAGTPAVGVSEYAGKAGYYTVKPGDSLIRIGLEVGQPWRDLARWNNLENPNKLEAGQVLRVASTVPLPVAGSLVPEPVSGPVAQGTPPVGSSTAPVKSGVVTAQPLAPATVSPATPAVTAKTGDDDMAFVWPAGGSVIAGFDEQKNKGLGISGKPGDAVLASADGRVVYAGSGLRGYGNLIILKHNNTYLSAYAHNQALLVKEDQSVKQGQKIAEMGSSDADRVKLHFEIRKQGKPVDPAKLLPTR